MVAVIASPLLAQLQPELQYFRPNDQRGINVFETSKTDTVGYEGVKVRVGGDFALQFQALDHSNENNTLIDLGTNLNLPRSEEHTSELQSRENLVCRLPPRAPLFPYTTLFRSTRIAILQTE